MREQWRAAPGFPGYEVSNRGRLRSVDRLNARGYKQAGHIMSPGVSNGYAFTKLRRDGKAVGVNVHVLVAIAFLGPRPFQGAIVRHLDDVGTHNDISNLQWGTHAENAADAVRNGRHALASSTVCRKGLHPLQGEHLTFRSDGRTRLCRTCRNEWQKKYRVARIAAGNPIGSKRTEGPPDGEEQSAEARGS